MYSSSIRLPLQSSSQSSRGLNGSYQEARGVGVEESTRADGTSGGVIRQVDSDDEQENVWATCEEESANVQKKLRKANNVEEVFGILVKEHVDFRDIRYQTLTAALDAEIEDFNRQADVFEGQVDSSQSADQIQSNLQQKFYQFRNRDQKDLHERFDKLIRVIRDGHIVEINNLTSKFKGIVKDSVQRAVDEQRKQFEAEHRQLIDNQYHLRATIHKLEEHSQHFHSKLEEKEKRLMECYDKIMKLNNESSNRNGDFDKYHRALKEKDVSIDKLTRQLKVLEQGEQQRKQVDSIIKEKDGQIKEIEGKVAEREKTIARLQRQLANQTDKVDKLQQQLYQQAEQRMIEQTQQPQVDQALTKMIQQSPLKTEMSLSASPVKEQPIITLSRRTVPDVGWTAPVLKEVSLTASQVHEKEIISHQTTQNSVFQPPAPMPAFQVFDSGERSLKPAQLVKKRKIMPVFVNSNQTGFKQLQKSRRDETNQFNAKTRELEQTIKLKEDQIKLLQVEVMGLREESDTYLQNLLEMRCTSSSSSKVKKRREASQPTLNDLLLDPTRIYSGELTGNNSSSSSSSKRVRTTGSSDEGKYVSSVFAKPVSALSTTLYSQAGSTRLHSKENNTREGLIYGNLSAVGNLQQHTGTNMFPQSAKSLRNDSHQQLQGSEQYYGVLNNSTIAKTLRDRANSQSNGYSGTMRDEAKLEDKYIQTAPSIRRPFRQSNSKAEGTATSEGKRGQHVYLTPFTSNSKSQNSFELILQEPENRI